MIKLTGCITLMVLLATGSCKKNESPALRYFEVGLENDSTDWRDSSLYSWPRKVCYAE
jgi:hypothetical protein